MIGYKDFFPSVTEKGFFSNKHEDLPAMVARANAWIAASGSKLVNVETVVLPNIESESDASQVNIRTSGDMRSYWFQVVRVWFESP